LAQQSIQPEARVVHRFVELSAFLLRELNALQFFNTNMKNNNNDFQM
jgi:hypothetical protein